MKKTIQTALLAGLVGIGAIAGDFKDKVTEQINKPTTELTRVQNEDKEPINRVTVRGKLPFDTDYYCMAQEQGDFDFYKVRLQYVPLQAGPFGAGATIQHKNSNMFPENNDWGLVGRLEGQPTQKSYGKLDVRYFPEENTIEEYGFIDTQNIFADCFGYYNTETDNACLNPGLDYKIGDNFRIGLEGKFTGKPDDLDRDYLGIRATLEY